MLTIRRYRESDREVLKRITVVCFEGVSIDQNIEKLHGRVAGKDWRWRKARHVDNDIEANADGVLVAEVEGEVVGYVTARVDPESRIGGIPNLSVLPTHQKQGIGRKLLDAAIAYLRDGGMAFCRIETLVQNDIGRHFYPQLGFREVARQIHFVMPLAADAAE